MFLQLACDFSQRGHTSKKRKGICISCGTIRVAKCKRQNHFRPHLSTFKSNRRKPTNFSKLWKPPLISTKINNKNIIEILCCFAGDGVHNLGTQICAQREEEHPQPRSTTASWVHATMRPLHNSFHPAFPGVWYKKEP